VPEGGGDGGYAEALSDEHRGRMVAQRVPTGRFDAGPLRHAPESLARPVPRPRLPAPVEDQPALARGELLDVLGEHR
jgi:hypothetical protein